MEGQLIQISYDVLAILIPALVALGVELLRRKLGAEKLGRIKSELETKKELATIAVKFAEQAYDGLNGPEKFTEATKWLTEQLKNHGIKVSDEEIQGLIEFALRQIKDELGEQWAESNAF